ncbi:MAG: UDP-N-acetylmuramoyl-L-alanyl-D-glutamate--2,6-diaminopimelate ligase [Alphaproteobacteria bacterium]
MLLKDLLLGRTLPVQAAQLAIRGLTADSREVKPGYLFAALPGTKTDGAAFIADAVGKGAVAVLAEEGVKADASVPIVRDANPRRTLALAAARFYACQPERIAAVTGTNGKTSVTVFARQIWTALGERAASMGTLGVLGPDGARLDEGAPLTTPDPVQLHAFVDRLAGEGFTRLALEASSHGLDQFRLDGVRVHAAAFTNLTRDHLDYHGTEAAYAAAKLRLFTELLSPEGTAVINLDGEHGAEFAAAAERAGRRMWRIGRTGSEIKLLETSPSARGQLIHLEAFGERTAIELPLIGAFQASNALIAAGLVVACGGDPARAIAALTRLQGVPGRMQLVGDVIRHGGSAHVHVDYAHTPDALRTVLRAIRPHASGKLHVVFGCGGDRDKGKRPLMGAAAAELADTVIVTDDNPRSESPADIRRAILEGMPPGGAREIGDRAEAIKAAIAGLSAGDILMIAGKGHETGQIVAGVTYLFDDAAVVRALIADESKRTSRHV